MKKNICFCFFLLCTISLFSQGNKEKKRINEKMKEANDKLLSYNYIGASNIYERILAKKPNFAPAKRGMAVCAMGLDKNEEAEEWLKDIDKNHPFFSQVTNYDLAKVYYRMGRYDDAVKAFEKFKAVSQMPRGKFGLNGQYEADLVKKYVYKLEDSIYECIYARDSIPAMGIKDVVNLGDAINTKSSDYFPFLTNDESVLLFSRNSSNEDFYVSTKKDGEWQEGIKINDGFNTSENEGMCTCTRDNIKLYFTACQRDNFEGTCDIEEATLNIEEDSIYVTKIKKIKGDLNTKMWESQASISCDGRMMFYSSNRRGGYGKTDIYVSYKLPDGSWSLGENVGGNINTDDYEESPFITNDGQTLFFSSMGLLGMGEQDIYMSRLQADGKWGRAVNLGNKINTSYRELGFFLTADGKTGYFASNRPSGKGGLDIYQFTLSTPIKSKPITFVEGYVRDSITKEPIQTVIETRDGQKIATDENGRFFRCLPPGDFIVEIQHNDYFKYQNNKPIPEWNNRSFFDVEFLLRQPEKLIVFHDPPEEPIQEVPKEIIEWVPEKPKEIIKTKIVKSKPISESIYFDFDHSIISTVEVLKLNQMWQKLQNRPYKKIIINAYCDYKGNDQYNIILSNKRALTVYRFLIEKGIPASLVQYSGLGEINDSNPRWINRRVDIFVVE